MGQSGKLFHLCHYTSASPQIRAESVAKTEIDRLGLKRSLP